MATGGTRRLQSHLELWCEGGLAEALRKHIQANVLSIHEKEKEMNRMKELLSLEGLIS